MRAAVVVVVLAWAGAARAQSYPPITDRDYALDLYSGAALGSIRIVGMGGAALGIAEGSAGAISNPAAAAVRLTTSKGSWDWDFHLDATTEVFASDFDNNGDRGDEAFGTQLGTGGLAGMYKGWGLAVTVTTQSSLVSVDSDRDRVTSQALTSELALAKELFDQAWTFGAAIKIGDFELDTVDGDTEARTTLFSLSGAGLELGALWRPPREDVRVGAALSFPVTGREVAPCTLPECAPYILPERVEIPWSIGAGVAWRRAPTWWNQQVSTKFRDERALLLAADVVVTGGVRDGAGIERFGQQQLQPSGRHAVISVRGGAEYEAIPARLRLRAGSYWEPSRFEGIGGRVHVTFGTEVSLFEVEPWSWRLRAKIALTADFAARYGNAGLSVGFWH